MVPRYNLSLLALAAAMAIAGCASTPSPESPQEYLDNETAATISVVGRPLVFARAHAERAAHMQDYVTLAGAAVDRSGRTDYVLIAYFWTTLDTLAHPGGDAGSHQAAATPSEAGRLILVADDRRIQLALEGHSAHEAGIGVPVHAPPVRSATAEIYRIDLATLRFLAVSRHLAALRSTEPDAPYEIWDDQRPALRALIDRLSGG